MLVVWFYFWLLPLFEWTVSLLQPLLPSRSSCRPAATALSSTTIFPISAAFPVPPIASPKMVSFSFIEIGMVGLLVYMSEWMSVFSLQLQMCEQCLLCDEQWRRFHHLRPLSHWFHSVFGRIQLRPVQCSLSSLCQLQWLPKGL